MALVLLFQLFRSAREGYELAARRRGFERSAHSVGALVGTYSKVESDFSILSLDICEEAGLLVRGDFVGECGGGDE